MRRLSTALAAFGALAWLVLGAGWFRGVRRVPVLRDIGGTGGRRRLPSLSVIVPARDEERSVGAGVGSMIAQDYPGDLEVIAVDDRSADRTNDVLRGLEREHPGRLRVIRVEELPDGWLGKNHALYAGAREARGEWLLFTDADVRLSPTCLSRAVDHAIANDLDHLTVPPEILSRGVLLKAFVAAFTLIFELTQRPWRASEPRARESVGVGAFNLVRGDVYESVGTHHAIAMRPDDDMKLAKLVKGGGFRQGVAYGTGLVRVEWHSTLAGAVRGLGKSAFPGVDYRLDVVAAGSAMLFVTNVFPFLGLIFSRGKTRFLFGCSVLTIFAVYAYHGRHSKLGVPLYCAALHPLSATFFIYAMLRSAFKILADGGIEWRGTMYPLDKLRNNVV